MLGVPNETDTERLRREAEAALRPDVPIEIVRYYKHLETLVSDFAESAGSGAPIFPWEPEWTPDWYEKREAQRKLARE